MSENLGWFFSESRSGRISAMGRDRGCITGYAEVSFAETRVLGSYDQA
jgi:hypothetical protein